MFEFTISIRSPETEIKYNPQCISHLASQITVVAAAAYVQANFPWKETRERTKVLFASLKSQAEKYCSLIYCERKIM
jgi:hypothetical protein